MSDDQFIFIKNLAKELLGQLPVMKGRTRVGIIRFSDSRRTRIISPLGSVTDSKLLNEILTNISMNETRGSATHHKDAMRLALNDIEERGRPNVRKIIILITDGPPTPHNQSAIEDAAVARARGYDIFAVGFTNNLSDFFLIDKELRSITFYKKRAITKNFFELLGYEAEDFINTVCNINGKLNDIIMIQYNTLIIHDVCFIVHPQLLVSTGVTVVKESGQNTSFNCTADGVPVPTIVWRKNGQLLVSGDRMTIVYTNISVGFRIQNISGVMQITNVLTITDLTGSDSGNYSCRVDNGGRPAILTKPFQLTVLECK